MKKIKFEKSMSYFVKCHILCARSAFIEKNTMAALQESFNDLSKFFFWCVLLTTLPVLKNWLFALLLLVSSETTEQVRLEQMTEPFVSV